MTSLTVSDLTEGEKIALCWLEAQAVDKQGVCNLEHLKRACTDEALRKFEDFGICKMRVIPRNDGKADRDVMSITTKDDTYHLAYPSHGFVHFTDEGLRLAGDVRFERATQPDDFKAQIMVMLTQATLQGKKTKASGS